MSVEQMKTRAAQWSNSNGHRGAFWAGWRAQVAGKERSANPYGTDTLQSRGFRNAWICGWEEGLDDDHFDERVENLDGEKKHATTDE